MVFVAMRAFVDDGSRLNVQLIQGLGTTLTGSNQSRQIVLCLDVLTIRVERDGTNHSSLLNQ